MAFNPATILAELDGNRSEGTIDKLIGKIKELATPPLAGQVDAISQHFTSVLDPIHKASAVLSGLRAGEGISKRVRMAAQPLVPHLGAMGSLAAKSGRFISGSARPGLPASRTAAEQPFQFASLAGLAEKVQQEAARQDSDRQHLQAQQEANQHLGNLAGAAAGAGLRVQVVGTQPGQW